MTPPAGSATTQAPPVVATKRSRIAGPKNHPVNIIHTAVSIRYCTTRWSFRVVCGLVAKRRTKAAVVHPHVFFIKYTLSAFFLLAK